MRSILFFAAMLAVSASALPRFASEQDLKRNARNPGDNNKSNTNNCTNSTDLQDSLTLDPKLINKNFEQNGMANNTPGQAPSLTSKNNFINHCATVNLPLTNGQQIKNGSCNSAPMGVIAPAANMPSCKFVFPTNFGTVKAHTQFEIQMALKHLDAGHFTNAETNYLAAPQQLNAQGDIIGHTHVVIEPLDAFNTTTPPDPTKFAFFKGINAAADANGVVSANVTGGLPPGKYKLSSINTSANHAPVLVSVAQHTSLDDQIYFAVTADGKPPKDLGN